MSYVTKILLLGAGELGKEFVIAAKRLNATVIAVDKYAHAPAMQVADTYEVIDMLDGDALASVVEKHQPNYIVPEIEAIRTEKLVEFENQGITVIPTAKATYLTMNRDAIRDAAANELSLRVANYAYASNISQLHAAIEKVGLPCVVKPVMSSSGKGQSIVNNASEIEWAWEYACAGMRGDKIKVIVEEFINFECEVTLLTVKQKQDPTIFVKPIGHRQENGDYRESWMPINISETNLQAMQSMAQKITDYLGGAGIFGVEFFITKDEVIFSELSPRPHDTGMVTLISQNLSEFDLHIRAILGLPIPAITYYGPSASAVILAKDSGENLVYHGLQEALQQENTDVRIFGKPNMTKFRRMGVALARADDIDSAIEKAKRAAASIQIESMIKTEVT